MDELVISQDIDERTNSQESVLNEFSSRKICFDVPKDDCFQQSCLNQKIETQSFKGKVFSRMARSKDSTFEFLKFLTSSFFLLLILFLIKNATSVSAHDSVDFMPEIFANASNSTMAPGQCRTVLVDQSQLEELLDDTNNIIFYKNKKHLNEMSYIVGDKTGHSKESLISYAVGALPQAMGFIDKIEKEIQNVRSNEGKKVTQSGPGFKVTQYTQIPYNQQVVNLENILKDVTDRTKVNLINSHNYLSSNAFFNFYERQFIPSYFLEDPNILDTRLANIVALTEVIVFDDQIKEFISSNFRGPVAPTELDIANGLRKFMEQKTLMRSNRRNNPQYYMFLEDLVSHIDPNGYLKDTDEFEVEMYTDKESQEISPVQENYQMKDPLNYKDKIKVVKTMKMTEIEQMKYGFHEMALKRYKNEKIRKMTKYKVVQKNIKGTMVFIEEETKDKKMRISYKFYKPRYPRVIDKYKDEPFTEDIFAYYDEKSIHYKDNRLFDDMITKILDEKEMWPPGIQTNDGRIITSLQELEMKNNQTCNKCQEQTPAHDFSRFLKFNPPFGSSMRDTYDYSKYSVYDFPTEDIRTQENIKFYKNYLYKKSVRQSHENYEKFRYYFGQALTTHVDSLSKYIFTNETFHYFKLPLLTGGILPRKLTDLPKKNKHAIFFSKNVEILHHSGMSNNYIFQLEPAMDTISVKNLKSDPIIIKDVMCNTPDCQIMTEDDDIQYPIKLEQGEKINFKVMMVAESFGSFDAIVYIVFETRVFLVYFEKMVGPNKFVLRPIFYDRVYHRQELNHPLVIANPYNYKIYVEEFYLTNNKFKADFKRNVQAQKNSQPLNIIIEGNSNRTLCNIIFKNKYPPSEEETYITIRFSSGDLVRIPFYLKTVNTLLETWPPVLDFGIIQLYQNPIRIQIMAMINLRDVKRIVDFHLPTDQPNLEFKIYDPPDMRENGDKAKLSERSKKQENHKIDSNKYSQFMLGHVYLNPVKAQMITTSIKVELEMAEVFNDTSRIWLASESMDYEDFLKEVPHHPNNKTIYIEIPIIASVVNHTQLFSAVEIAKEPHYNSSMPIPLYMADRNLAMPANRFNQSMGGFIIQPDLLIQNNFQKQVLLHYQRTKPSVAEVYMFTYTQSNQIIQVSSTYQPDHHEQLGWYRINTLDSKIDFLNNLERFKMSNGSVMAYKEQYIELYKAPYFSGNKIVWIRVDDVMIPQHVQIYDRNLACRYVKQDHQSRQGLTQFKTEEQDMLVYLYAGTTDDNTKAPFFEPGYFESQGKNSSHITQCQFLTEIDFGKVATGVSKDITLVIYNMNPIPVVFEKMKKRSIDDLRVSLTKVTDKMGNIVEPIWKNKPADKVVLNSFKNNQKMGMIIQPFEQLFIKFEIISQNEESRESFVDFIFDTDKFKNFSIKYKYQVLEGSITFKPQTFRYKPSFQGMLDYKIITAQSNFSIPIQIKSIKTNDPRIDVRIVDTEIKPWAMSISGMVIFDASMTGSQALKTEFLKSISQYSIDNPPIIHKGSMVVRNQNDLDKIKILSGINSTTGGIQKFSQLSDQEVIMMIKSLEESFSPNEGVIDPMNNTNSVFKKIGLQSRSMQGGPSIFSTPEKDFKVSEGLNYKDILSWRERQEFWAQIQRQGKIFINTTFEIETTMNQKIIIPVEATLKKPELTIYPSELDFDDVQIGDATSKDIKIFNPTDDAIQIQLFVATDLDDEYFKGQNKRNQKAIADKTAFSDKMLRQIEIYMKGVNIDLVQQVDYLFETFQQQNASNVHINYDNIKNPKSRQDIVDILLRYTQNAKNKTNSASIDEILYYWKQFDEELNHNFVGKYCIKVFMEHSNIYDYLSYKDYLEDTVKGDENIINPNQKIGWKEYIKMHRFYLNERENPISQCHYSIQYVYTLNKMIQEQELSKQTSSDYDFSISTIQNYYKIMYQQSYDYDWKINNAMEKCNLTMPIGVDNQLENLGSVESITKVLRSIFYYDTMQTWKRLQTGNNRLKSQLRDASITQTAPIAQIQERYIQFQTYMIPFSHVQHRRYSTQEERAGLQISLQRIDKAIEMYKTQQATIDIGNDEDLYANWPDQVVKTLLKIVEEENQANALSNQDDILVFTKDFFSKFMYFLGGLLGYDKYEYVRVTNKDSESILNPLSSINDRFSLKNQYIQKEMIQNNIRMREKKIENYRKHQSSSSDRPLQSFYLNPKFEGRVFIVPAKQNLTIENAVYFEPNMIEQDFNENLQLEIMRLKKINGTQHLLQDLEFQTNQVKMPNKMQLLIKNNLTLIQPVNLKGHGSSALIEIVDIQKGNISVSKSHQHDLRALQNISSETNFIFDEPITQFSESNSLYLQNLLGGTDTHVINYLFDEKTAAEIHRKQSFDQDLTISQQILANSYHQKQFLSKNDRYILSLQQQSFKNYITFNLPISDIFMRRTHVHRLEKDCFYTDCDLSSLTFVTMPELFYISQQNLQHNEESIDPNDPDWLIQEEHEKLVEEQAQVANKMSAVMSKYVGREVMEWSLRYQIGQILGRWDNQDYRVDLNWTEFQTVLKKGHQVEINHVHERNIVFMNSGSLNMTITLMQIDGKKCGDEIMLVSNCDELQTSIEPKQNVTIKLKYFEKFLRTRTTKVLSIHTDQFVQKFFIDIIVPEIAQEYVHKIESQFATFGSLQNLVFILLKICLTTALIIHFKNMIFISTRVVADQKMYNNCIYPVLDLPPDPNPDEEVPPQITESDSTLSKKQIWRHFKHINWLLNSIYSPRAFESFGPSLSTIMPVESKRLSGPPTPEKPIVFSQYLQTRQSFAIQTKAQDKGETGLLSQNFNSQVLTLLNRKQLVIFESQKQSMKQVVEAQKEAQAAKKEAEKKEAEEAKVTVKVQSKKKKSTMKIVEEPKPKSPSPPKQRERSPSVPKQPFEKKQKVKKLTKAEVKKQEARAREQEQLAINAKLVLEQKLLQERLEKQREEKAKKLLEEHESPPQVIPEPEPVVLIEQEIDIQSYHSSQKDKNDFIQNKAYNSDDNLKRSILSIQPQDEAKSPYSPQIVEKKTVVQSKFSLPIVSDDGNFWVNYEKNLGIVKDEKKSESNEDKKSEEKKSEDKKSEEKKSEEKISQSEEKKSEIVEEEKKSESEQTDQKEEAENIAQVAETETVFHYIVEFETPNIPDPPKLEVIPIPEEPKVEEKEEDHHATDPEEEILKVDDNDSDSEADLPLFQTKKYLAKLKKDELELKKKKKQPPPKKKEQVRKVYEQEREQETKEAARLLLLNSRNPKADINNPNNPNYKGRPENKHIEQFLNIQNQSKAETQAPKSIPSKAPVAVSEKSEEEVEEPYYDEQYYYYNRATRYEDRYRKPYPSKYAPEADYRYKEAPQGLDPYYSTRGRGRGRGTTPSFEFDDYMYYSSMPRGRGQRVRGRGRATESLYHYDDYKKFPSKYRYEEEYYEEPIEQTYGKWEKYQRYEPMVEEEPVTFPKKYEPKQPEMKKESSYDHDQVMLNRRARGRGGAEIRGRGAPVRGRGTIGRGRGVPYVQEPAYTFKPKEKEPVKEAPKEETVPHIKKEIVKKPEEVKHQEPIPPISKSIYETFMDVSSIFSNPIQSFGGEGQGRANRSRFFNDTGEASSEDEYDRKLADPIFSSSSLFARDSGAGLSSSSFANLRQRALNEDSYEMQPSQNPVFSQKPVFGGMGALPVPEFLKDRFHQETIFPKKLPPRREREKFESTEGGNTKKLVPQKYKNHEYDSEEEKIMNIIGE